MGSLRLCLSMFVLATGIGSFAFAQGAVETGAPDAMVHKDVVGSLVLPKVSFLSPKDGDTVKSQFLAKFQVQVLKTGKAKGEPKIGEGHFHVIIDGEPVPSGEVIPHDETHLHFEKGQKEARLKLAPGPHTLTLQFGDGTHRSYGEAMSHTIHVTVK